MLQVYIFLYDDELYHHHLASAIANPHKLFMLFWEDKLAPDNLVITVPYTQKNSKKVVCSKAKSHKITITAQCCAKNATVWTAYTIEIHDIQIPMTSQQASMRTHYFPQWFVSLFSLADLEGNVTFASMLQLFTDIKLQHAICGWNQPHWPPPTDRFNAVSECQLHKWRQHGLWHPKLLLMYLYIYTYTHR